MAPTSSPKMELPGAVAVAIEASEEARVQRQSQVRLALPGMAGRSRAKRLEPELPSQGKLDAALLAEGGSRALGQQLASAFERDLPEDSGRTNGRTAGLSCRYKGTYMEEVFSPKAVVEHLQLAKRFWPPEPAQNVIDLSVAEGNQLIIVGDTHGQLEDVLWIFFKHGWPSPQNQYLFNGDIVDRGGHAVEILLLLFAIKRDCPESLHILRGNHEDTNCTIHYGFKTELESKFAEHLSAVWNVCTTTVFPLLPIAAVCTDLLTQRRVGVVHGGLPVGLPSFPSPVSLQDLCSVDRQRPTVQKLPASDQGGQLLYGFLWADPASSEEEKKSSNSRAGKFVESETRAFCERNNLALLVRSHEVPRTLRGVEQHHGGLCITVFSASNYCGSVGNRGAVLILRPGGGRTEPEALEHWAPPWPRLCTFLATGGDDGVLAARWEAAFGICPTDCLLGVDAPAETCEESVSASREQLMQFMAERIVEHKEELFDAFCQADADCTGVVDVSSWLDAMRQVLAPHCSVLTVQMLLEMAKNWSLKTPVPYVKFLHRFQIRDNPEDGSVLVDRIKIVSQLQNKLVDFSAINLEQLLDPDGDKAVSHREFASFLPQFHIQVPPWQAAALYETMAGMVDQDPINLDNTILCLALVSQDPPKREDDPCADVADAIGRKIMQSGDSLASIFRSWDEDNSGFLSLAELKNGLRSLPMSHRFTDEEVAVCMSKIDSLGKEDERLSIFEFIRALAPRRVTLELQRSMIREVLKRVWVCRPALLSSLSTRDPEATNEVDWDAFCECVREVNAVIKEMGLPGLTDTQIQVVCEVAAAGREEVRYNEFVHGLHVEDTWTPKEMLPSLRSWLSRLVGFLPC